MTYEKKSHQFWVLALHNSLNKPGKYLDRYIEAMSENDSELEDVEQIILVRGLRLHHFVPPDRIREISTPRMSASFGSMASFSALAILWRCNWFPWVIVSDAS